MAREDQILDELLTEMRETRKEVQGMRLEMSDFRGQVNTRLATQDGQIDTAAHQVDTHKSQIGWLYGLFGIMTISMIVKWVAG